MRSFKITNRLQHFNTACVTKNMGTISDVAGILGRGGD
jgi:hypothetical protein